jgi:hypothetical protein
LAEQFARMVGPLARPAVILPIGRKRRSMEPVNHLPVARLEGEMDA